MNKDYLFHSTCYDRQFLRKIIIEFNEKKISYQLENIADKSFAKAPGSGYFESGIYILEQDYGKADEIIKSLSDYDHYRKP